MSEFEKIPKDDAREVDDASHERITFLLQKLDYAHGDNEQDFYHGFHCTDYDELTSLYGYESIIVGTDDGLIIVEVAHLPDSGEERKDLYTYCPEDRSLVLQTTIEYDNEHLDNLNAHLDGLSAEAHQHKQAAIEAYNMLINGLRNEKKWAGVFRQYDDLAEKIAAKLQAAFDAGDDELMHRLEVTRLENEAIILDFLTKLAEIDTSVADVLQIYQHSTQVHQAIEAQMSQLIMRIGDEESTTLPAVSVRAGDFIALLDMTSNLKNEEE